MFYAQSRKNVWTNFDKILYERTYTYRGLTHKVFLIPENVQFLMDSGCTHGAQLVAYKL